MRGDPVHSAIRTASVLGTDRQGDIREGVEGAIRVPGRHHEHQRAGEGADKEDAGGGPGKAVLGVAVPGGPVDEEVPEQEQRGGADNAAGAEQHEPVPGKGGCILILLLAYSRNRSCKTRRTCTW